MMMMGMTVTFEIICKLALAIDGVAEGTSYGTPAFKVSGKLIARFRENSEALVVGTTCEEREELISAEPETYFVTDHYVKHPWALVRLSKVRLDSVRNPLVRAARLAAVASNRKLAPAKTSGCEAQALVVS